MISSKKYHSYFPRKPSLRPFLIVKEHKSLPYPEGRPGRKDLGVARHQAP